MRCARKQGLLRLRKDMELFANLRPAICYPALASASSSLKPELVEGLDILIVRGTSTGGVYFGEPKEIVDLGNGQKRGIDAQVYDTYRDRAHRRRRLRAGPDPQERTSASMEKRNVMKSGVLWNQVVTADAQGEIFRRRASTTCWPMPAACSSSVAPKQFDVIVTDNLFGDMLSDVAAMLTGSLGMLPSASLGAPDAEDRQAARRSTSQVHGSAPDIAGTGVANPIAMIASFAMCLRYSFGMVKEA